MILLRSLAIGVASGMRSSLGVTAPGLFRPGAGANPATARRVLAIWGELVSDKLPKTPSRLEPPGLAARFVSGGVGALVLARRAGAPPVVPLLAGLAGAAVGAYGGAAWRRWAAARRPDWQGAVVEDAVGIGLAVAACRAG
jgi:uncharacterized membrane protein